MISGFLTSLAYDNFGLVGVFVANVSQLMVAGVAALLVLRVAKS